MNKIKLIKNLIETWIYKKFPTIRTYYSSQSYQQPDYNGRWWNVQEIDTCLKNQEKILITSTTPKVSDEVEVEIIAGVLMGHKILENEEIEYLVKLLNTPAGKIVKKLYRKDNTNKLYLSGIGSIWDHNKVSLESIVCLSLSR